MMELETQIQTAPVSIDWDTIHNYRLREVKKPYALCAYLPSEMSIHINWNHFHVVRARLIHRIITIGALLGLKRETCQLAISYMTRVLLVHPLEHMQNQSLLLVTVLVIASKIEEVHPPSIQDMLNEFIEAACNKEQVLVNERVVLKQLNWQLYPATTVTWLSMVLKGLNTTEVQAEQQHTIAIACNILDAASLDSYSLNFLPSVLAGSALLLVAPFHDLYTIAHLMQLKPEAIWDCLSYLRAFSRYASYPLPLAVKDPYRLKRISVTDRLMVQVMSTSVAFPSIIMPNTINFPPPVAPLVVYNCHENETDSEYSQPNSLCSSPYTSEAANCGLSSSASANVYDTYYTTGACTNTSGGMVHVGSSTNNPYASQYSNGLSTYNTNPSHHQYQSHPSSMTTDSGYSNGLCYGGKDVPALYSTNLHTHNSTNYGTTQYTYSDPYHLESSTQYDRYHDTYSTNHSEMSMENTNIGKDYYWQNPIHYDFLQ